MSRVGQCCVNVADLERGVDFYTALGLECASRTEIEQAYEAVMANAAGGGRLQLAQQKAESGPVDVGTALGGPLHRDAGRSVGGRGGDRRRGDASDRHVDP